MDIDLRKLRYFVAVAEELHFGRAAQALHIAQPVLSRQIQALEHELKAPLFVRNRRSAELTPAGEQLLAEARPLLAAAEALRRRVAHVASGADVFTVGFMPGLIVTPAVRELRERHPQLTVEVMRTNWSERIEAIHDGRVDVGYVRLPIEQRGLGVAPLLTEPRVVVVSAGHRLAGKDIVELSDLADEHLLQDPESVPEWRDIATELRQPRHDAPRPFFQAVEEKLEHVAADHGIVILARSVLDFYTRPDVAYIPIAGIAPNQVCLAWDSTQRNPLISEFVAIAQELQGDTVR